MLFSFQNSIPDLLGGGSLERTPATITLIYLGGVALVVLVLLVFVLFTRRRKSALSNEAAEHLPEEVRRRLGTTAANRGLKVLRVIYVLLAFAVFGFHVYWTLYAEETNETFQALSYKDLRNRRISASNLRGWILDRSGTLDNAFASYTVDGNKKIARVYSLEREMAHLMGTERGTPGLERGLFARRSEATPESLDVASTFERPPDTNRDARLTIDRNLQQFAAAQLAGKKGAVVVMNPQNGEVLAMYSNPSFTLTEARDLNGFLALEANKRDKPLLNRALGEFYVPGSTFKTFTMAAAFRNGKENQRFTSTGGGYAPYRGQRSITDANGGCEPPDGCTTLDITRAFTISSNQYFTQMAVALGRDRMAETARLFGIAPVNEPEDAVRGGFLPDIWNASNNAIKGAVAPRQSTLVTGKDITLYDLALEGMGQGYAGQMTPFQMALVASAVANLEGKLMKPKIELDREPEMYAQVVSPSQAAQMRLIMNQVTEGSGGTGVRVFAPVRAAGIRTGGKTGTAEKQVPIYEKNGRLRKIKVKRRDDDGKIIEVEKIALEDRTDSWYISIAPLERPTLAIAVVVEGGGYGAAVAAPICANVILKARELGLLGSIENPTNTPVNQASPARRRR